MNAPAGAALLPRRARGACRPIALSWNWRPSSSRRSRRCWQPVLPCVVRHAQHVLQFLRLAGQSPPADTCQPAQLTNCLRNKVCLYQLLPSPAPCLQDSYQPSQVADGLWIVPVWSSPPDPAATNILLEPGVGSWGWGCGWGGGAGWGAGWVDGFEGWVGWGGCGRKGGLASNGPSRGLLAPRCSASASCYPPPWA